MPSAERDDVYTPLTHDVRTPLDVVRIAYTDLGDSGIDVEVEGQERTLQATGGRLVVDTMRLVREGGKLLVDSHARAVRS
ncbi:MAG: hypothetical protein ABWZ85_11110 [Luteibacter sp.]